MNLISNIIATLSNGDKKKFKKELKQKNKRSDTKNLELFELLDSQTEIKDIDKVLYGKKAKGAYHALSKRLHDTLIDFIATKNFERESSEEMDALKLVLASRLFIQHQQIPTAFKTLSKAELKAKKYGLYTILNEVYQTQIMNAHLSDSINLQDTITKYRNNKLILLQEEKLNLFYAAIHDELNNNNPIATDIIIRNLKTHDISITTDLGYPALYKILQIANQVANSKRDYYSILNFVENACRKIEVSERIETKYLFEHIQILYYLANTNFRIKKFENSYRYLESMNTYMQLQNEKHYTFFYPQYALIKNLVLIYTGDADKAIKNINEFDYLKFKKQKEYLLDLKLTLVVALFLKNKFKEALQVYREFYHSDTWYFDKMGNIWVIKKNLLEIIILIELNHMDLVESRLNSFRKKHRAHLIMHKELRVLEFLKFISIYYYKTTNIHSSEFKKKVDNLLQIKIKEEDVFVLSFYAWLKSKTNTTEIYQTCLDYINNK